MLLTDPAVFVVGQSYQIMAPVSCDCMFWVETGGQKYIDECNGVVRSNCRFHRVIVPQAVLDTAGEYTVCTRSVNDRQPYSATLGEEVRKNYNFVPVTSATPRVYCISDTHFQFNQAVAAAKAFGKMDCLVLNGDLPEGAINVEVYENIYDMIAQITGGTIPVVFARGNHDLRGAAAEHFPEFAPNDNGRLYYTFRLGPIWGIVLDCGEDKSDDHNEYYGLICCHAYRERQTEFIRKILQEAESEYAAPDVALKLIISHNPFVHRLKYPFDIEQEIYSEWIHLLRKIKPDYMISGHLHVCEVHHPDEEQWNQNGSLCPVFIGGIPRQGDTNWNGMGLSFEKNSCTVIYNNNLGVTFHKESV